MSKVNKDTVNEIRELVTDLFEDKMSYDDFLREFPAKEHRDVRRLLNLIEHQPSARGLFGRDQSKLSGEYEADVNPERWFGNHSVGARPA